MSTNMQKKHRNFPTHSLEEALALPQKILDEMAGKPFKRLLLADAIGMSPSSSNFRILLSSSYQYGLTEGTEKATEIKLTDLGQAATQSSDPAKRQAALRQAAAKPPVFGMFFDAFKDRKVPSAELLPKILSSEYKVPEKHAKECADLLVNNGRFTGIVRDIGGSAHILFEDILIENLQLPVGERQDNTLHKAPTERQSPKVPGSHTEPPTEEPMRAKPIFIGHGKNKAPLEQLQKILTTFQIPYKVTVDEANLGRPIPQKVKETMLQCGSAILIFTCDEKFFDEQRNEVWRPSENVVHELGAASFAYGDRIVIYKEKGLTFPTNYQSIGYIEFEAKAIESKTADLIKELIGFGLVRISPT